MANFKGKGVLVTGASGSIGTEVARQLVASGARVALSGRREKRLAALAAELEAAGEEPVAVLPADLARGGEASRLAGEAVGALGGVDVLINNAGASLQGLSWVVGDRDEARKVFETNLWSPLALVSALAPPMAARREGAIVNVGSMARVSPFPHLGHYAASRAALAAWTQVLRLELASRGVRVVEVALGPVDTPASRENRVLAGAERWLDGRPGLGRPEAAATAIVEAAAADTEGVAYYPGMLRWVDRLPGLGRRYSKRAARHADLDDTAVRFGGPGGDPELLASRDGSEEATTATRP